MKTLRYFIAASALGLIILSSCVPARKYEEMKVKQEECQDELAKVKAECDGATSKIKELEAELEDNKKVLTTLKRDTSLLGNSNRRLRDQYDKMEELNKEIMRKLEYLQGQSEQESSNLSSELEVTKLELQRKEDRLNRLERDLNSLEDELNRKESLLKEREQRVNELEDLLRRQKEALEELRSKVSEALVGFKNKGLTVEERDGKVYVSMEAKLLFPSGSINVDPKGEEAIVQLAEALEGQDDLDIMVEGHTDTDALRSSSHPKDNWELSVLRATSVVKIMLKNSDLDPKSIVAAGRSEYIPVDPNDKAKNRRIEVILQPDLSELFEIINNQ